MAHAVELPSARRGNLVVHPFTRAVPLGVDAFVTDRFGGVSESPYDELNLAPHVGDDPVRVRANRRLVAEAIGVSTDRLVTARQVHGADVLEVEGPVDGEADALVTAARDLAIAVLVADCVPILLVDEASPLVGVVHAGWRGLANGVVGNAVGHFSAAGTLHAFVGPSISIDRYQVGPEVAGLFDDVSGAVVADEGDRSRLDLRRVALEQLRSLGVREENIVVSRQSTDGGRPFYSDRAARPCGRFALVARRRS